MIHIREMLNAAAVLIAATFWIAPAASGASGQATRDQVLAAMKKAATFMVEEVALHGGYVWVVSEDLEERWGEIPARPSQIWLQGGTERVGQILLDAHAATGDGYYLEGARKAADALVFGQHHLGGWHYFIDFDPAGIPEWYDTVASRYRHGYEEYRHYYGNATYDDRVTADAARFLMRFYRMTRDAAYREPVRKALDFVLMSQYANGAWPQRYPPPDEPPPDELAHGALQDYTSFYTLNDGVAEHNIRLLLEAHETFGDRRYWNAARRAVDALIALHGPADQACWAEQYAGDMQPAAARTHEPAGYVVRESRGMIAVLQDMFLRTGDARYLAPVPRCLDWFDRINRESMARRYPRPRYWEPGSNRPLYVVRTNESTPDGYGKYKWTTDPAQTDCDGRPCVGDGKPIVEVDALRAEHAAIAALDTAESRSAYRAAVAARNRHPDADPATIIAAMDPRGAWVTDGLDVPHTPAPDGPLLDERVVVRGISTAVFVEHISAMIASLRRTTP